MLPPEQGTKYTEGERMLYITAEEAARCWGVTTRLVQRYCKQGRIAGAEKLGAKIRNAQLWKTPYMVVVGGRDEAAEQISVRSRADGDLGAMKLDDFAAKLSAELEA